MRASARLDPKTRAKITQTHGPLKKGGSCARDEVKITKDDLRAFGESG